MLSDRMKPLMSSAGRDWETPPELFDPLNELFDFDLDVCATKENTKTEKFISPEDDAFSTEWDGARMWMNPPYGKGEKRCKYPLDKCAKKKCVERGHHLLQDSPGIGEWVNRAYEQVEKHGSTVACLLPARTDTRWFQAVWDHAALICFFRGRYKFVGADSGATFPSVLAVFSARELPDSIYEGMTLLGNVIDPREGMVMIFDSKRT